MPDGRRQSATPASAPAARFYRKVNWPHPACANGHIVHRNDYEIIRVSLRAADYR